MDTGKPGMLNNLPTFDYLKQNPQDFAILSNAMKEISEDTMDPLLQNYDFAKCGKIADVGGGIGHLIIAILKKYPQLTGILFDLSQVVGQVKKIF